MAVIGEWVAVSDDCLDKALFAAGITSVPISLLHDGDTEGLYLLKSNIHFQTMLSHELALDSDHPSLEGLRPFSKSSSSNLSFHFGILLLVDLVSWNG